MKQSPVCSRVTVDLVTDGEGRVAELGQEVRACALGQAAASLMGAHAIGRTPEELAEARDGLAEFLAGRRDDPGPLARPRHLRRGAAVHGPPPVDPARLRGRG